MANTRVLLSDDGVWRTYQVLDSKGIEVGTDQEPSAGSPMANQAVLAERAKTALAANDTFLAIASPTNAQTLAQTQKLTKECSALIRLLLGLTDTIAGT